MRGGGDVSGAETESAGSDGIDGENSKRSPSDLRRTDRASFDGDFDGVEDVVVDGVEASGDAIILISGSSRATDGGSLDATSASNEPSRTA